MLSLNVQQLLLLFDVWTVSCCFILHLWTARWTTSRSNRSAWPTGPLAGGRRKATRIAISVAVTRWPIPGPAIEPCMSFEPFQPPLCIEINNVLTVRWIARTDPLVPESRGVEQFATISFAKSLGQFHDVPTTADRKFLLKGSRLRPKLPPPQHQALDTQSLPAAGPAQAAWVVDNAG